MHHAFPSLLYIHFAQQQARFRGHPEILRKTPLLRPIFVNVMRQFSVEEHQTPFSLVNPLKVLHQIYILINSWVWLILLAPFLYMARKSTDTFKASTYFVRISQGQNSGYLLVAIKRQFIDFAHPLCKFFRQVVVISSPIFPISQRTPSPQRNLSKHPVYWLATKEKIIQCV